MSFISTYSQGFALRIVTGLGAGVVMSCCTPTLGLTIANKLGAHLLTAYSWQAAFRVTGYIAIAIAVLIFAAVRNVKKEGSAEKVTLLSGIKAVFTTRNLIVVCLAGFFYMFLNLGVSTWANSYLSNIGFDTVTAASIMSVYSVGGIIGSLLTGIIVKKFNLSTKFYLIGVYIALIITTILFGFQTDLAVLNIVGFIYGFVTYLPNAHLNAQITKYAPEGMSASVMGVQNCIFQLASILSPLLVGWTVDVTGAFQTCWFTLAIIVAVGIVFLLLIQEEKEK